MNITCNWRVNLITVFYSIVGFFAIFVTKQAISCQETGLKNVNLQDFLNFYCERMKNRSKFALMLVAALSVFSAKAQDEKEVWHLETSTQVSIPMENVSFLIAADDDTHFSVVTKDEVTYDGILSATFAKHKVSGVGQVDAERVAVFPTVANSTLNISGCKQGTHITVGSLDGQVCLSTDVAADGATIDVSGLSSGCYILTVGEQTVKFIKQ